MRQDNWQNTVTIDGVPMGIWDTLSGGDVDSEETKYRPGGMQPQRALGGPPMVNNVTLGKLLEREHWAFMKNLMQNRCGRARVSVARQPLDDDANPFGDPMVYGGILKDVNPGDTDSNSADAQVWEIEVSTEGTIG